MVRKSKAEDIELLVDNLRQDDVDELTAEAALEKGNWVIREALSML